MTWQSEPPQDAEPGDAVWIRMRKRKWQTGKFPARLIESKHDAWWYETQNRTFVASEGVHEFWSVAYKMPKEE